MKSRLDEIEDVVAIEPILVLPEDVRWLAERLRFMYTMYGDPDAPKPQGVIRAD